MAYLLLHRHSLWIGISYFLFANQFFSIDQVSPQLLYLWYPCTIELNENVYVRQHHHFANSILSINVYYVLQNILSKIFVLQLFNLSICQFNCFRWHNITHLVGSTNPLSCTVAGSQLKYFKIDIGIFQIIAQINKFYHVWLLGKIWMW